jgi:hypothetical protein
MFFQLEYAFLHMENYESADQERTQTSPGPSPLQETRMGYAKFWLVKFNDVVFIFHKK